MKLTLDSWQKQVMDTKGSICLRSGRQVGKSTVISIKAAEYAMNNRNKSVMVIASVERQAQLLFEKILAHVHNTKKSIICTGKKKPTKHKLQLNNGSVIHCLPTGESGYGIRGYTIDLLIADEAAFIPEDVWTAVTPMLAVRKGDIWLLSTPHGREGYYYRCFQDDHFTAFHVSAEDCPRKDQAFLDHEKQWMTKRQYAQEYLGEFVDELMQFFSEEVIKKACTLNRRQILHNCDYYLGVDIARMGADESTFEIVQRFNRDKYEHVENLITRKTKITDTIRHILLLDSKFDFRRIYIDSTGMGAGVLDQLLEEEQTRRKVVAIENVKKSLEHGDKPGRRKTFKEDLYNNLLRLIERGELSLLDDPEIALSLRSIQFEYTDQGNLKIYGNYSHIVEGLIRAAWCAKDKGLNIWIA